MVARSVYVTTFTNGLIGPEQPMLGPVADGGQIVVETAPGCWGPMITPAIRGGHEVAQPVAVEGAEPGDAIAIRVVAVEVTSIAAASGYGEAVPGRFDGDPVCAAVCPGCGAPWPETALQGTGPEAVRCRGCGAPAAPFALTHGYTMVFDEPRALAVTAPAATAERLAVDAADNVALPAGSRQHPVLALAPHDLVGVATRLRPFLGQLGTVPSITMPDSHNAGDFGQALVGAAHQYKLDAAQLDEHRTDGHMDIAAVRAGATVVCPVKVAGGGVYAGDMHAMQGAGEIAGHTCDVSGTVTLEVRLLKGVTLEGPVLFPRVEDLPFLAQPLSADERAAALALAQAAGLDAIEDDVPISVVGTGPDLNAATDNGLERAARLLGMSVGEVANRATVAGAVEIGRHPGVVQITFRAPVAAVDACGLLAATRRSTPELDTH